MNTIAIGQQQSLDQANISGNKALELNFIRQGDVAIEVGCYGIDANDKLVSDDYEVFFGRPESACGCLKIKNQDPLANGVIPIISEIEIQLSTLPAEVESLVFAVTAETYLNQPTQQSFKNLELLAVELVQEEQKAVMTYMPCDLSENSASLLLRISRKDGSWVITNTAESFSGSLPDLFEHFGGVFADK